MFMRIVRARPRRGAGPAFIAQAREAISARADVPGMCWSYVASQLRDDGEETILIVSLWQDVEAFTDTVGGDIHRPHLSDEQMGFLEEAMVEYFEVGAADEPWVRVQSVASRDLATPTPPTHPAV